LLSGQVRSELDLGLPAMQFVVIHDFYCALIEGNHRQYPGTEFWLGGAALEFRP
jgi:hypothetical protein